MIWQVVLASPTSADQQNEPVRLLRNVPLARLAHNEAYALPLSATSPATALEAARKLGIQPPPTSERQQETTSGEQHSGTPLARRRSSVASLRPAAGRAPLRIEEQGDGIFLHLDPAPPLRTGTSSAESTSPSSTTPTGGSCEYLVVLHFDLSTGRLHLPHFANSVRSVPRSDSLVHELLRQLTLGKNNKHQISIPTPLCLRNALTLTLPSPSPDSPFSAWDLSVRPSLSNAASLLHTAVDAASTQITGNFPSTPSLSLRWAPQLAPSDEAQLLLPHATVSTAWTVEPGQVARGQVDAQVGFAYSGLREKQWVEIEVDAPRTAVDVLDCVGTSGTTVLDWEVTAAEVSSSLSSRSSLTTKPSSPDSSLVKPVGRKTSGSSLGLGVPSSVTPSTSRRRSSNRPAEARPPGFHSLFDTAMPAPPVLDTSFVTEISSSDLLDTSRRHASSGSSNRRGASEEASTAVVADALPPMEQDADLLRQAAPFDPEASALDMSFEVGSLPSSTHSDSTNGDPVRNSVACGASATSAAKTIIRIQVDLGPALRAFAVDSLADRPYLAFRLSLAGKSIVDVGATGSTPLPSVQFPSAETEDRVVTVRAQSGLRLALDGDRWQPVCESDGEIRWTTSRSATRWEAGLEPLTIVLLPRSSSVETSPQLSAVADGRAGDEELTPLLDETEVSFAESLDADVDTSFATVTPGPDDRQHSTALHGTPASYDPDAVEAEDIPEARSRDSSESVRETTAKPDGRETAAAVEPPSTQMQDEETQTALSSLMPIDTVTPPATEKPDTRDSAVQTLPLPSSKSAKSGTRTTASRDDPLVKSLTRLLMLVTLALIGTQGWHYLRGGHPSPIARYRSRHSMPKYPLSRQQQYEHTRNANTLVSFDRKTATVTQTVFSTETRVATVTSVSTRTEHRTITSLHSLTTTVTSSTPTTNPRPLPVYSDDFTAAAPATPSSTIVSPPPPHRQPDPAALPSINEAPTVAAQFVIWLHSVRLEMRGFLSRWRDWLRL